LGGHNNKGGLEHSAGFPMIYIQRIKPVVYTLPTHGKEQKREVIPCTITYTPPLKK
jgi:hypothetical protein